MTAQTLATKAAKSLFAKHVASIEPEDPLYETGLDSRGKRVRRQLPEGLSKRDQKILQKVKKRAHYLDKGMNLCGFRVGWTFVFGLVPGLGDAVDFGLGYLLVIRPSRKAEVPAWIIGKMMVNQGISTGVGLVPIVGDVMLAVWKTNSRNAHILEEYLAIRGQQFLDLLASGNFDANTIIDPALKNEYKPGAGKLPKEVILPRAQLEQQQHQHHGGFMGLFGARAQHTAEVAHDHDNGPITGGQSHVNRSAAVTQGQVGPPPLPSRDSGRGYGATGNTTVARG